MQTPHRTRRVRTSPFYALALGAVALAAGLAAGTSGAAAQSGPDPMRERFSKSISLSDVKQHLRALNRIARANGNTRAAGTPGYAASGDYVREQLTAAGYEPVTQEFDYTQFIELSPSQLNKIGGKTYVNGEDILVMSYSGNGIATGRIIPTNDLVIPATPLPSSNSGCEPGDFPPNTAGNIALMQRGTCNFIVKVQNAIAAGAVGAVIFNEGNSSDPTRIPLFGGTLGEQVSIPVLSASYAVGVELSENPGRYRVAVEAEFRTTTTFNIIADTPSGNKNQTIVVGAHLDSVPAGPGINDNGSGSSAILEIARQMGLKGIRPENRVRFAFWGGEEDGLLGSTFYVGTLTNRRLEEIALNLNFDMLGSPNFARFVYDGNGSDGAAGPEGSAQIESVFLRYFERLGLATNPTDFDGRSDYGPFIEVGIPAGGLFSGAEGIKTQRQVRLFGGDAGVAYDECYHQACDDLTNINEEGLMQHSRAAADSVIYWAMKARLFPAQDRAKVAAVADTFEYLGPKLKR